VLLETIRAVFGETCSTRCSFLPDGDNVDADKLCGLAPLWSSAAALQLFGLLLSLKLGICVF